MTTGPQLLFGRWQSVNTKLSSWIIPKGQLMIKEKSNWMSDLINAVYNQSTFQFSSVQLLSRVWLFCSPMNRSTLGLPVHHQLPESTHVHCIGDAIQPSHPLSSPSPPAHNPSQHQSLFQWVNSSHEVAKVFQHQHHSFQWTPRTGLL